MEGKICDFGKGRIYKMVNNEWVKWDVEKDKAA